VTSKPFQCERIPTLKWAETTAYDNRIKQVINGRSIYGSGEWVDNYYSQLMRQREIEWTDHVEAYSRGVGPLIAPQGNTTRSTSHPIATTGVTPMANWERSNFTILQKENGYVVTVGCKEFAFANVPTLIDAVRLYLEEPRKAAKSFLRDPKGTVGEDLS